MAQPFRVGIDVGGTHLRVGVVEGGAVVWEHREVAHLARRLRAAARGEALPLVLETLVAAARRGFAHVGGAAAVGGVGFAFPGFFASTRGRLALSPNLPGLEDVDLQGPLAAALGVPVAVENDALAAAWGEWALHPERPASILYAGLGTGVGGGLVLGGRPWRGDHGFGTELGHLIAVPGGRPCGCGHRGCLEQYASASAVARRYAEATGTPSAGDALEAREVAERARAGDGAAREAFREAGDALAAAIAHALTLLDLGHVVIGGGLASAWDLLEPAFRDRLAASALPVLAGHFEVRVSTSGDRAGMLGAALLVDPPSTGRIERSGREVDDGRG